MAVNTFTWNPEVDPQGSYKKVIRTAKFGDGYQQDVSDGINASFDTWNLTFFQPNATIAAIEAFLNAQKGYIAFYWTPPLRTQGYYICKEFQVTPHGGLYSDLNAVFERVYRL